MSYVVAFNRDRDFYQLPLALHERGLLTRLITDYYRPDAAWVSRLPVLSRLAHRHADGLPSRLVTSRWRDVLWQVLGPRLGVSLYRMSRDVAADLSLTALRTAARRGANLFLYSEYAMEAFQRPEAAAMRKGLFFFHPHTRMIRQILSADFADHPECGWSMEHDFDMAQPAVQLDRLDREWSLADFIVCASGFTKRSLTASGCPPEKVAVVPYGIDVERVPFAENARPGRDGLCRFLFVGQGVQRKGLHHLLKAWGRLRLPHAELVVVAAVVDPGIAALAGPGVRILSRQSRADLWRLYNESHVFVMPSLVEGFGLVYLEALAAGCYAIGTDNTGLPDLAASAAEAAVVPPGDIEALAAALAAARERHAQGGLDHRAIRAFAANHGWADFRRAVADVAAAEPAGGTMSRAIPGRNDAKNR